MDDAYWVQEIKELMKKLKSNTNASIFVQPIEEIINSFPLYSTIIENPIDLPKIEHKLNYDQYNYIEEFKSDIDLMCNNCKNFNNPNSWAHKVGLAFENFFNREYKKSLAKIEKYQQNMTLNQTSKKKYSQKLENLNRMGSIGSDHNIQVISSTEDERILKKIRNLFIKLGDDLDVSEEQREEIINWVLKSIIKRNKSFDQLYEDTTKLLAKHLKNTEIKSFFSKKFRKFLRVIKEEQNAQQEGKAFNIKINLNENEEKREEKDKLDQIRKEVLNFIDNQKIPEILRSSTEYPIEPSLRKKISAHVNDIRNSFTIWNN
jgi:hypothetical protein